MSSPELGEGRDDALYGHRIISRFEADGFLEAGRQRMVIRNPHGLLKVADDLD
jgi:hypothetical protein